MGIKLTVVDENELDKITDFSLDVDDMEFDSDWGMPAQQPAPRKNSLQQSPIRTGQVQRTTVRTNQAPVQEELIFDSSDSVDIIDLDEWLTAPDTSNEPATFTPRIPDKAFEPTSPLTTEEDLFNTSSNPFLEQLQRQQQTKKSQPQPTNRPQPKPKPKKSNVQVFSSLEDEPFGTGSLLQPIREKPVVSNDIPVYNQRNLREDTSIYMGTEIEAAVEFEGKLYRWVEQVCGWFSNW